VWALKVRFSERMAIGSTLWAVKHIKTIFTHFYTSEKFLDGWGMLRA
jgi:hypothetical protein